MKTNAIVRIVLFSLAVLVLLSILLVGLGVGMFSFNRMSGSSGEFIPGSAGSVDPNAVRELEIEWVSGSITIEPGDCTDISFRETGVTDTKYQMVWKQTGDKLVIEFCEDSTNNWFGINIGSDLSKDLVIGVPYSWVCDTLDIDTAAAKVYVTDLTINEVDFDGASGICTFENCDVGELNMDTASGDVEFTGTLSSLAFDGMSANCRVEVTNVPSQISMSSMSGDLDLTLPEDCGFTVSMDAMSSEFHSDFETTTSNGHHVHGDGSCRINVDAMSGDVTIRKGTDHH